MNLILIPLGAPSFALGVVAAGAKTLAVHLLDHRFRPRGSFREYASTLTLTPGVDGKSSIATTLNLRIKTTASWLARKTVEQNIRESASAALQKQEQAICNVVQQTAGELIILPEIK